MAARNDLVKENIARVNPVGVMSNGSEVFGGRNTLDNL
jgi:hypothetical protein